MPKFDIQFYDVEFLDGYFSGTFFLFDKNERVVLDFGYDVEFEILTLQNCKNPLYNSFFQYYRSEQIADLQFDYSEQIKIRIREYLLLNYRHQEPKDEY